MQVLAVRRHRPDHQDLGPGEQEHGGGAAARGAGQRQERPAAVPVPRMVRRRPDSLRRLQRQPHQGLAGEQGQRIAVNLDMMNFYELFNHD